MTDEEASMLEDATDLLSNLTQFADGVEAAADEVYDDRFVRLALYAVNLIAAEATVLARFLSLKLVTDVDIIGTIDIPDDASGAEDP